MKKLVLLLALTAGISSTSLFAQEQRDPAQMAQRMKERMKPQLIEQTKLSDSDAGKVMDLIIEQRQQMRGLRDLSPDERTQKMEELNNDLAKKLKAVPLTDDQVKAVQAFLEAQRQQMRNRQNASGGGR